MQRSACPRLLANEGQKTCLKKSDLEPKIAQGRFHKSYSIKPTGLLAYSLSYSASYSSSRLLLSFLRRFAAAAERAARPVPNKTTVIGSGIATGAAGGRGVAVGSSGSGGSSVLVGVAVGGVTPGSGVFVLVGTGVRVGVADGVSPG
jgi:hypothetical protein